MVDDDSSVDPLGEDLEEGRRRRPHQELGHRAAVLVASLADLKQRIYTYVQGLSDTNESRHSKEVI